MMQERCYPAGPNPGCKSASRAKKVARMVRPSDQGIGAVFMLVIRAQKERIRVQMAMIRSGKKRFATRISRVALFTTRL